MASSRRDLDARKRAWEVATPKNRMQGLAPGILLEVEPPKTLTMLYRGFGKWPCDGWEAVSKEDEHVVVVAKRGTVENASQVKEVCVQTITQTFETTRLKDCGGSCLPLSVWQKRELRRKGVGEQHESKNK